MNKQLSQKILPGLIALLLPVMLVLMPFMSHVAAHRVDSSGGSYDLSWWTVAGGGGTSNGTGTSLSGTIGQPEAGISNGGTYHLTGGFWGVEADQVPPVVVSSVRSNPNPSALASVGYTVRFSKPVTGVDKTDFSLTVTGLSGASVSSVSGSGAVYTVMMKTGSGNGTLRLNVIDDDSIKDSSGNPLGGVGPGNGNFTSGEVYAVIKTLTITGNAGDAGVVLHYTDGTAKTATSGSNGHYSISVPYKWSGTVTPSKTGVTFNPAKRSYSSLTANQTGQNYTDTVLFKSSGANDGYILESGKGSGKGGTMNSSATTFQLGDDALNRQYRSILSFNTASLPDTASISAAALKVKQSGSLTGTNPFTFPSSLYADIKKGSFGTSAALELADFNAAATASKAGTFGATPSFGWYTASLSSTGRSDVNKTSLTQLRLYFSKATNGNGKVDFIRFLSGNSPSDQPELIITYSLP